MRRQRAAEAAPRRRDRERRTSRRIASRTRAGVAGDTGGDITARAHAAAAGNSAVTAFPIVDGVLHAERVPLSAIAARFGTPCYVYSRAALESRFRAFDGAFAGTPHLVCYAVKANSSLAVLNILARLGSGFDIVSGGELSRVIAAGGDPAKIVFSGVGKTAAEMEAALVAGIRCFNVESAAELEVLNALACRVGRIAPISLRVNPDVDPKTHPYIATGLKESKFGVAFSDAVDLYRRAASLPGVEVRGIDCHIGSQITDLSVCVEAATKMFELVDRLAGEGIALDHVDFGGGLGVRYRDEETIDPYAYALAIRRLVGARPHELLFEPGRFLVGDAGVLLTRVLYLKPGEDRDFAIVDAAMNDLLRPALYDAWHAVEPVTKSDVPARRWNIVGPVCESADFLAHDRLLSLSDGDLLAVRGAGAYAFAMSSNYNSRPRACEVVVAGERMHLVRPREDAAELFARETKLP
jgi:diaminopimelate decarboxylase